MFYFRTDDEQHAQVAALLDMLRSRNPHVTKADVLRELVTLGLREKTRTRKAEK